MNANELADILQQSDFLAMDFAEDAATMLRQQQAEIEALKKEAALQRLSDFTQEAENEPVAWMGEYYDGTKTELYFEKIQTKLPYCLYKTAIPLYTHPAKTLTDEEIHKVDREVLNEFNGEDYVLRFAKAILRKAQKK